MLERFIERRKMRRKIAMYTSNVLSVPFIVMESQLVATLPYAVVTRFASLTTQVAAALPPFDLTYDLKLHWHRRFDNEPRSIWLRDQLAAVFKDHQWLPPPSARRLFSSRSRTRSSASAGPDRKRMTMKRVHQTVFLAASRRDAAGHRR